MTSFGLSSAMSSMDGIDVKARKGEGEEALESGARVTCLGGLFKPVMYPVASSGSRKGKCAAEAITAQQRSGNKRCIRISYLSTFKQDTRLARHWVCLPHQSRRVMVIKHTPLSGPNPLHLLQNEQCQFSDRQRSSVLHGTHQDASAFVCVR